MKKDLTYEVLFESDDSHRRWWYSTRELTLEEFQAKDRTDREEKRLLLKYPAFKKAVDSKDPQRIKAVRALIR